MPDTQTEFKKGESVIYTRPGDTEPRIFIYDVDTVSDHCWIKSEQYFEVKKADIKSFNEYVIEQKAHIVKQ